MKILKDLMTFIKNPSILYFAMGLNVALFLLFFMLNSIQMMLLALGSGLLCYFTILLNKDNKDE